MKDMDIQLLLQKASELKALFVLGQRVIPFLEEIFIFVNDIKPLLEDINHSIEENLKKMPNASKQLSKVTEATEMATTEIMDIVDGLVYKADIITSNLKKMQELNKAGKDNPVQILEVIYKALQSDVDTNEILEQLSSAIKNLKGGADKEFNDVFGSTNELLDSIKMDSSSIMMSLQVQDITSQQIAAVNHLLETVQNKLGQILERFQSSDIGELVKDKDDHFERTNVTKLHRNIAFDPEAVDSIANKDTRQGEVDKLINSQNEEESAGSTQQESINDTEPEAQANSDDAADLDIDALFSNVNMDDSPTQDNSVPENVTENQEENKPAPKDTKVEDSFENFSQDDIDALFGN